MEPKSVNSSYLTSAFGVCASKTALFQKPKLAGHFAGELEIDYE
jgi:hypothetical protein